MLSFTDKEHHAKPSVIVSERATSERIKRRGLHHPLTPEFMLLRLNTMQKAQSMDEVGINMERNARLRDSWGPSLDQDPLQLGSELRTLKLSTQARRHPEAQKRAQTCIPILKKSLQPTYNKYNSRHSISSQHWHTQANQEGEWARWTCHRGAPGSWIATDRDQAAHHALAGREGQDRRKEIDTNSYFYNKDVSHGLILKCVSIKFH